MTENQRELSHTTRRRGTGDCCYEHDRLQLQNGRPCQRQTDPYAVLKRDPRPALQRNLNNEVKLENQQDRLSMLQQTDM